MESVEAVLIASGQYGGSNRCIDDFVGAPN